MNNLKKSIHAALSKKTTYFRKASWKKRIAIITGFIIVLAIAYKILIPVDHRSKYDLAVAEYSQITEMVSETGNVTAAGVIPVYSTTTGIVEEVFVKNGEIVSDDTILFKVKSTATKQEKSTAYASYMSAKSTLESAKAIQLSIQANMFSKWDSFKELAESDDYETSNGAPKYSERGVAEFHVPEKEWLSAEASYKNQTQIINEKSVAVSAAWQAYQATQDSEVTTVLGGEINNLGVAKGDLVAAPTVSMANVSPVLVLTDSTVNTYIKISVNENDAIKVKEGQSAEVEFDAMSGQKYSATVERVDTVASSTQDVIRYYVYILLDETPDLIQRGMTADVDITVASKDNILTVPSSAVKPYQGKKAVRIVNNKGEIEFIPVEVGIKGNNKREILSGIEEGTEVIVSLANDQIERSGGLF